MENEESLTQAKQIAIKLKFIKDYATRGIGQPCYIHSEETAAVMFTKAFRPVRLQQSVWLCSLIRETIKDQDMIDVTNTRLREEGVLESKDSTLPSVGRFAEMIQGSK